VGSSTLLNKCNYWGPPLLYRALVGRVVAEIPQDDKLLGLWCSLVDALAHPQRVGTVSIAVHDQQGRMAPRDGCHIVPLVGKPMRHPTWNAPGMNGPVACGRECATDNHAVRCGMKVGVGIE